MNLFGTKTLLKTCLNTKQKLIFFLSKVLSKLPKKWGINRPSPNRAVRLICQSDRPAVDRSVDRQRSKIRPLEPPVDRLVDPNKQRALLSDRSTGPCASQTCTRLCTSVDRSVDRLLVRSTARSPS